MHPIPNSSSILVVDDQSVSLALTQAALARLGYANVETVQSPVDAFEAIRTRRFELVLSDWHMPKMDGPELFRQVQRIAGSRRPRFFFLTADNGWAPHVACRELGADGLLIKPKRPMDMLQTLSRALSTH